ncbi:hypothetical protein CONPUDRAFT_139678 [Coniophora puteana RWD-64-598 SS2]|uniref:DUF6593 domain-containing protein n=1 Tax=Coniophora puteana (strain RWD-64-598) TaxID=741705 RepID=A0A5M3MB07_CONPW|nr:uncharacterized protein CONPUDRAFT_139678 [Coniophora puteana RWD-64-598 SS2]EIW76263.1 hypothetical protein CONPUDRAFT_139678 [Coniophora puteana RWD-64-598 SS2]
MSGPYILLQFGSDPFDYKLEDLEGRPAFTMYVEGTPNVVMHIAREAEWRQQHTTIMGPDNSFLYFGPERMPGYMVYGNGAQQPMTSSLRKKDSSGSRFFTSQSGKELKWKITPQRMECSDGRTSVATWELSQPEDMFHARLTVKAAGMPIVTEVMTTLALNRMASELGWNLE